MTQGIKIDDRTVSVNTSCGIGKSGIFSQKIWSGADDPEKRRVNQYSMTYVMWRDSTFDWYFDANPAQIYTGTYGSCWGGVWFDTCALDDNDQLTLINRLGEAIRGHGFDAANSIGAEGKDALKQVAGAAESFYHGMKQLKRGNIGGALSNFGLNPKMEKTVGLHKSLSGKVLATQLGWLPLLGDIKSATEALDAIVSRPLERTYSSKVQVKGSGHPATASGVNVGTAVRSRKLVWTLSATPTFAGQLSISNPWDIADMLWNAATLSFIADWFIPVGDYLNAQSIITEFKGSGYINNRYVCQAQCSYVPTGAHANGASYYYRSVEFSRSPVNTLSAPLPTIRDFKKVPSWNRALTAVTLAAQILL